MDNQTSLAQPAPSSTEWETPRYFFAALNNIFGFDLDVASTDENALCQHYFTSTEDGLTQPWWLPEQVVSRVWMNPPFNDAKTWVPKALAEVRVGRAELCIGVLLASTDTRWWHDCVMGWATRVWLVAGRVPFEYRGQPYAQNRYPTAVVLWHGSRMGRPEFLSVDALRPRF